MTGSDRHNGPIALDSCEEGIQEITDFPAGVSRNRYASHFINIDRRSLSNTVFQIDDNTFTPSLPRASHWSIAWSDLMMTMFILFLSMFAYQTANEEFLVKKTPEIIGGDTTEALQTVDSSGASFPFAPISPGLPLITGGTVKKVEKVTIDSLDPDAVYQTEPLSQPEPKEPIEQQELKSSTKDPITSEKIGQPLDINDNISFDTTVAPSAAPPDTIVQPGPAAIEKPETIKTDQFQEIYTLSKDALKSNNLDKFAAIDIIPDKTMRIILTGDLLFALGESELSRDARTSLQKIVEVMQHTPYMINIVGHTDNVPMRSNRFKGNWELSVARASTVARFLIDEMGMDPSQFVVSGYSSYRPIAPNTTAENRAKNRRVEIIISKRLPNPLPATKQNLE